MEPKSSTKVRKNTSAEGGTAKKPNRSAGNTNAPVKAKTATVAVDDNGPEEGTIDTKFTAFASDVRGDVAASLVDTAPPAASPTASPVRAGGTCKSCGACNDDRKAAGKYHNKIYPPASDGSSSCNSPGIRARRAAGLAEAAAKQEGISSANVVVSNDQEGTFNVQGLVLLAPTLPALGGTDQLPCITQMKGTYADVSKVIGCVVGVASRKICLPG